jgi:hypothetical protein
LPEQGEVQPLKPEVLYDWGEVPQWHSRAYSRPARGRGGVCERQKDWQRGIVMFEEARVARGRARGKVSLKQPR